MALAWTDDETPRQPPTLTDTEAAEIEAASARRAEIGWIMSGRDDHDLPTLETLLGRPARHSAALCVGKTSMMFSTAPASLERARSLCSICPVRQECLEDAMADPDLLGVWASTTPGAAGDAAGAGGVGMDGEGR